MTAKRKAPARRRRSAAPPIVPSQVDNTTASDAPVSQMQFLSLVAAVELLAGNAGAGLQANIRSLCAHARGVTPDRYATAGEIPGGANKRRPGAPPVKLG